MFIDTELDPAVERQESVAGNYGRTILAWLRAQPGGVARDIDRAQAELGLDDIQFTMGLNWCVRNDLITNFFITPEGRQPMGDDIFCSPPRHYRRPHRLPSELWDDDEDDEDDCDDDLEKKDEDAPPVKRPASADSSRPRMYALQGANRPAAPQKRPDVLLFAIMNSVAGLLALWFTGKFQSLDVADRLVFGLFLYFVLILLIFMPGLLIPRE